MNLPALHLGAVGYSSTQDKSALNAQLKDCVDSGFEWQLCDSMDADAILLSGERCRLERGQTTGGQGASVHLAVDMGLGRFAKLDLAQLHTPTIISLPAESELRTYPHFLWVGQEEDGGCKLQHALHTVTCALRYERILYALGEGILQQQALPYQEWESQLQPHALHIQDEGQLIAVIEPQRRVLFFCPQAYPLRSSSWEWCKRPAGAGAQYPAHFVQVTVDEALWEYAMRTPDVDWPDWMEQIPLHLLRRPNVRTSMLRQRHIRLLQILQQHTLSSARMHVLLHEAEGAAAHGACGAISHLQRDLFALYLCGCLPEPERAGQTVASPSWLRSMRELLSTDFSSSLMGAGTSQFEEEVRPSVFASLFTRRVGSSRFDDA